MGFRTPYEAGYDCGKNGANLTNCHSSHFSTPEKTRMWELGKRDAEQQHHTGAKEE